MTYAVDTTSGPIDAFDLATNCVDAWKAFVSTHGLA